jgi:hypothetical protein
MMGLVMAVVVHSAGIQDRDGGRFVVNRLAAKHHEAPLLKVIFSDGGYAGRFLKWVKAAMEHLGWDAKGHQKARPGRVQGTAQAVGHPTGFWLAGLAKKVGQGL